MEFSGTPVTFIETCLRQNGYRMFSTYRVLEEAERTYDPENPPYNKIKVKRKMLDEYQDINLESSLAQISDDQQRVELLRELQAARRIRKNANSKREEERQLELEEEANLLNAQAEGTMLDCQCCFDDYPVNRMVHCDSEEVLHWFCRGCARQNAETMIGQSKYQLVCMAMEGCTSSFSIAQR
jgi:E3 ubiquitin-protein ligase RNF216